MDCRSCEKLINQYLDGELSKNTEEKFQSHLRECKACKREFDQYMFMNDQLANLEELSPKEEFEARVLSQLQSYETNESHESYKINGAHEIHEGHEVAGSHGAHEIHETHKTHEALKTREVQRLRRESPAEEGKSKKSEKSPRNRIQDFILIFAYFITLFVVLSVLRNAFFLNMDWLSGIMVTGRVFREVFDGVIFRGALSLFIVYPVRIFHWVRVNFSQMSIEGRMMYSLVVMNLLLVLTFSHLLLRKLAKGRGKGTGNETS